MADGYALSLQKGLVLALKADADIVALVGARVYDDPPKTAASPFVRIGGIEVRPLRSDCGTAANITFGIEAHSQPVKSGRVEATRIAEAVWSALDGADVTVDGFNMVQLHVQTQSVTRDSDGKSYTAIVAFRTVLDG